MRIGLIGYGKMGHEIETIALSRGHSIDLTIDKDNLNDLTPENLKKVDVVIEFTIPASAYSNVLKCVEAEVPVVSGTTGWVEKQKEVETIVRSGKGTFFYATNYSIGVNIFFKINQKMAEYINGIGGYGVSMKEIHHNQKLDAPSGTAITLANIIADSMKAITGWTLSPDRVEGKIPIEAVREGSVPGTHIVTFDSEQDQIVLSHMAKSRKGLALGALLAAEFIHGKKGYFTMDDMLKIE